MSEINPEVMPGNSDDGLEPGMIGDPDLGVEGDAAPRPEIEDGEPTLVNEDED